eukprot:439283-Pyramimonas_sp.AAC.1
MIGGEEVSGGTSGPPYHDVTGRRRISGAGIESARRGVQPGGAGSCLSTRQAPQPRELFFIHLDLLRLQWENTYPAMTFI